MPDSLFNTYQKKEGFTEPDDQIYYLLAKNGLFMIKKTILYTASTIIFETKKERELGWLEKHSAGFKLNLRKKMPAEMMKKIVSFFSEVAKIHEGSEAIVLLYWDLAAEDYALICPKQEVGKATLPFYEIGSNPQGMLRIGSIHSHGEISAFHSAVDEHDEKHDDGLHITVGNIDTIPSYSCSLVCDGERVKVPLARIIENPEKVEFPAEWMDNVKKRVYYPQSSFVKGVKDFARETFGVVGGHYVGHPSYVPAKGAGSAGESYRHVKEKIRGKFYFGQKVKVVATDTELRDPANKEPGFNEGIIRWLGKELTIKGESNIKDCFIVEENAWIWKGDWLEPVEEEELEKNAFETDHVGPRKKKRSKS